ncbi:hypothetical protein K457DRAFT_131305 [Linnemannia elongata AG-77]|uniref:Galactose oxidase n=1 Tax=Linnemannia elongata AG-77 TaxID=1314771 RepID=A0A197JD25_9FUNG|nr:hypothetical protein K457DRAFT_131305 [Linnemannia elongata AG-77]
MQPPHRRSRKQGVSTTLLITTLACLFSAHPLSVSAQSSSTQTSTPTPSSLPSQAPDAGPVPVTGAGFARAATRLYVLGGLPSTANNTLPLGQFFSLDLTLAWNASSPAWTRLASGPKQRIFPATFSKNQKSMIVFRAGEPNYIRRYIVASGNWSLSKVNLTYGNREGVGAVTDPNNGLVYIARGYTDINERSVDVYNVDTDNLSELPLPPATSFLAQRTYYGNVWCQPRKSILYFGGYALETQPAPISPDITEFVPSNQTWSTLKTNGEPPSLRADHCMTINEYGTRMVVYGGSPNDQSPMSGEVFMFDTTTLTWTKGKAGEPRAYATCTIAGNQLLIWGGMTANKTVASGDVMIYNMDNDTWVQGYVPPAWYLNPSATNSAGADPSSTSDSDKDGGEKLHDAGYGTPINGKSRKEEKEELQTLREQLAAQKEQQEALQRQLEELKNQHSQDAAYGYQPPIYYPPGSSSVIPTQPEIFQPYSEQGPVVYTPTSPPPPIPPRIPVTTEISSGNVSATVSSSVPLSQVGTLVRSPEGLIQDQQQPLSSHGSPRSPEELPNHPNQQQSAVLYQDLDASQTGARRLNNPHTPVISSGGPHAVVP